MSERRTEVAAAASSRDPAVGLRRWRALRRLLESLEELQVANARAQGWSWQQIADALAREQAGGAQEVPPVRALRRPGEA